MRRAALWLLCAAALSGRARALPLMDGEELVYNVAWIVVPGAGRITVSAHAAKDAQGRPILEVLTKTETRGLAHMFLPFEAWANSIYDAASGRLLRFEETSKMRDKSAHHTMTFDYANHVIINVDSRRPSPERIPFPADRDPVDLINCVMETRQWHMRPGQKRDVFVFFERDFYPLTIHAIEYEDVNAPGFSSTPALLLEPRMEETPPKGMFKRGGTVKVWVGDWEGEPLPLRFQVEFKFGSGVATLIEHHPGVAMTVPGAAPTPGAQN